MSFQARLIHRKVYAAVEAASFRPTADRSEKDLQMSQDELLAEMEVLRRRVTELEVIQVRLAKAEEAPESSEDQLSSKSSYSQMLYLGGNLQKCH